MKQDLRKDIREIALEVYNDKGVKRLFEIGDKKAYGEDVLKSALLNAVGGEWTPRNFKRNRMEVYEVLEDVLILPTKRELESVLKNVVEVVDLDLGDTIEWTVPSVQKFKVAKIASGHKDIRRQRIEGDRKVDIKTEWFGIKIYEEGEKFITGRIDFVALVENVKKSFEDHVSKTITKTIMESYSSLTSGDKLYAEGAVTKQKLRNLITRAESKSGMKCAVYGTATALSQIADIQIANASDSMKDEYGKVGYFGNFEKTPLIEMPQYVNDEDDFELNDDELYILPIGLKTIKVVFEGEPMVDDTSNGSIFARNDLQIEMLFFRKIGIGILISNYHGFYKIK